LFRFACAQRPGTLFRFACAQRPGTLFRFACAQRKSREREPIASSMLPIRSATTVTAPVAFCS
jgi:hypothetical protein